MEDKKVKKENGVYQLDLTWEELEEQRIVNERKNNPPKPKIKKYI